MIYKKVLNRESFVLKDELLWGEICPFCKLKILKYEKAVYLASKMENIIQFHFGHFDCFNNYRAEKPKIEIEKKLDKKPEKLQLELL